MNKFPKIDPRSVTYALDSISEFPPKKKHKDISEIITTTYFILFVSRECQIKI